MQGFLGRTFGVIGGGQLGQMMAYRAVLLGLKVFVYSDSEGSPACLFASKSVIGRYDDEAKMLQFAAECDYLTVEFESIDSGVLAKIEGLFPSKLSPNSKAIFTFQERLREKTFLNKIGVKTTEFEAVNSADGALKFLKRHGNFILKTISGGYDGKGQFVIKTPEDIEDIKFNGVEFIAEKFVNFAFEASCILTRSRDGRIAIFPMPKNHHKNGILYKSIVKKGDISVESMVKMAECTRKIAENIGYVGTLACEFFIMENGDVVANEVAPRPHNSGHFTMDLCSVCQFENHVRAVCGLPIFEPKLEKGGEMLNLIGEDINLVIKNIDKPNVRVHVYGKTEARPGRKMGHITYIYDEISG